MKKFNIVLISFLVAQSTNTYSMNAVRRAASRAVNRLVPRAKTLAEFLVAKSPSRKITNLPIPAKNMTQKTVKAKLETKKIASKIESKQVQKYSILKTTFTKPSKNKYLKHALMGVTTFGLGCSLESEEQQLHLLSRFNLNYNGLLDILKKYKTTNINWHSGDLYEHSVWVAKTIESWFKSKDEWAEGLSQEDADITLIAGLLHDIGKAGDLNFTYYDKKTHPYDGFLYLINKKTFYIDTDNIFDFDQWFKENNISAEQRKVIAILVGIHWEFGRILKELNRTKRRYSRKHLFDKFLTALGDLAKEANYNNGIIDERLIKLAILINAADLKGTNHVPCCSNDQLGLDDCKETHPGQNVYTKFEYETKGKTLRKELIKYFNDKSTLTSLINSNILDKRTSEHNHILKCLNSQTKLDKCIDFMQELERNQQLQKCLSKKYVLEESGHIAFFHSQNSKFGFLQDFTKELITLMIQINLIPPAPIKDDFLFIQNHEHMLTKQSNALMQKFRQEQAQLISGRDSRIEKQRDPKRLSVNFLLSGNTLRMRSCTWNFARNNFSANSIPIDLYSNLLSQLHIPLKVAKKYSDRFNKLMEKYVALFSRGRILLIAIPRSEVDQTAYLSAPDAYKTTARSTSGTISKPTEYHDIAQNSSNEMDFFNLDRRSQAVVVLTQAYALNAYSNIKVFAFDPEPTDQAEYEQYLEERKQLAEDIAKDVAELNKQTHEFDGLEVCCKEITEAAKTAQSFY